MRQQHGELLQQADGGAEDVAEHLNGAEMFGRDPVDHGVKFPHVLVGDGLLDAAVHVEHVDDEPAAVAGHPVVQVALQCRQQLRL